jgi:hypothetical protein
MTLADLATLRGMSTVDLWALAAEIRGFLVDNIRQTGGHLGPNLGAVELTIALHRVFDSPRDLLLFDTGHQTYVHKMLTGRDCGALRRVRLPVAHRVATRRDRELARVDRAEILRAHGLDASGITATVLRRLKAA